MGVFFDRNTLHGKLIAVDIIIKGELEKDKLVSTVDYCIQLVIETLGIKVIIIIMFSRFDPSRGLTIFNLLTKGYDPFCELTHMSYLFLTFTLNSIFDYCGSINFKTTFFLHEI